MRLVGSRAIMSVADQSLAMEWEKDGLLRSRSRELSRLTMWPNPATMGVQSMKACSLNARVLELTNSFWVERADKPSAIPINVIRDQAC